jgi:DNA polymerase
MSTHGGSLKEEALEHLRWELTVGGIGVPRGVPRAYAKPPNVASPGSGHEPARESSVVSALPLQTPSAANPTYEEVVQAPRARADGASLRLRLAQLEEEVRTCTRCALHEARTQTVFARGNPESPVVFVGEGPGQEEDLQGSPFVGPAGQLLDKMIAAMGFSRDDVYICNVVKCRPPNNRTPLPEEGAACSPFLTGQLEAVAPRVLVALGRCAAENMRLVPANGGWRGRWGKYLGFDVMPTYHPAFLLRSPEFKRPVWEDLQQVMARLKG